MDLYLPNHLKPTRQLLEGSLRLRPTEAAPAIPAELLRDLQLRYTATRKLVIEPPAAAESLFQKFWSLLSTPAVGATAIIVGVLSFAIPAMLPSDSTETFRGNASAMELRTVPIYVTGGPLEMSDVLASSGDFEPEAIHNIESRDVAMKLDGPLVIVDFGEGEVLGVDAAGNVVSRGGLPEDIEGVGIAVARAVSRL